jgi:hypothetical protein
MTSRCQQSIYGFIGYAEDFTSAADSRAAQFEKKSTIFEAASPLQTPALKLLQLNT